MITLLERRAAPAVEALGSGWSRQFQPPSIRRDGGIYDADLDRFLADLPVNGVRSVSRARWAKLKSSRMVPGTAAARPGRASRWRVQSAQRCAAT
jgi:hypothetical protein